MTLAAGPGEQGTAPPTGLLLALACLLIISPARKC
jgi:hypothetical protein